MGDTVILWAFGLPFLPVYADYYVLTGSRWRHQLWLIDRKTRHKSFPTHSLQFGQFLASVPTTSSANELHLDFDSSEYDFRFNHTDLVAVFLPDGITLTTLPNIVGLRPQSGPNALLVMDRPGLISENEWTQAAQQYTRTPHLRLRVTTEGTHVTTDRSKMPTQKAVEVTKSQ
jgi:hypothetical protein